MFRVWTNLRFLIVSGILLLPTGSICAQGKNGSSRGKTSYYDRLVDKNGLIDVDKLPSFMRERMGLDEYLKKRGIRGGKVTKEHIQDFIAYRRQQKEEQEEKGSSPAGPSAPSEKLREEWNLSVSREEFAARWKRTLDSYFFERDRNRDKQLSVHEMSDNLRLNLRKYDANRDGKINYDEAKNYFHGKLTTQLARRDNKPIQSHPQEQNDHNILEKRPVVYRAAIFPKELKGTWFESTDRDGDGQVGLYEWRKAGKNLNEFGVYDRNRDGFITPEEMLFYSKSRGKRQE